MLNFFGKKLSLFNYLNLELSNTQKIIIKIKEHSLICNFNNIHSHELHETNSHLNSLVDLIINLGENLRTSQLEFKNDLEDLKNRKNKNTNLDYIKIKTQ